MGSKDPRIDAYIAKSADFAKPVLAHIRKLVHANCPDANETIKWGMPFLSTATVFFATWPRSRRIARLVFGWAIC